jgi:Uma2 family endonuclease
MALAAKMTAEDFLAMDDPRRGLQLVNGEVVVNQPGLAHQRACVHIVYLVQRWIEEGGGGGIVSMPLDVKLAEDQVYSPDVLWYAPGREPTAETPHPYPLPDLAVEVRSPSTWRYDVGTKKRVYERRGLRELWLVDTASRSVLVFRRSRPEATSFDIELEVGAGERLRSPMLPGLAVEVGTMLGA